ncbi:ATP-binding protein [Streptomyces sp. NBC_00344]|uniref:ATP-binding protein n=1 Tax=Streptomyces sp. NBC_00344 TaxID=2975720 RepID=UPI002E208D0F
MRDEFDHQEIWEGRDGGVLERTPSVDWTCRPVLAAEARDAVAGFVAELSPAPPAHTVQNLVLLVSELVTNALRHAGGVTLMRLSAGRRTLEVAVADLSPVQPQDRTPDLTGRTGGFGWPMVQRLARTVAVRAGADGGKVVLATLSR